MANTDFAYGLRPWSGDGAPPRVTSYDLAAANTVIAQNSLVLRNELGYADASTAVAPPDGAILGVAAEYKAANSGGTIKVYDDPKQKYLIQAEGTVAQTHIGTWCNLKTATGLDATTKWSTIEIDQATYSNTKPSLLFIEALSPEVGNALGANADVIVTINPQKFAKTQSQITTVSFADPYATTNVVTRNFWTAPRPMRVVGIRAFVSAAAATATTHTLALEKCTGTAAPGGGTTLMTGTINLLTIVANTVTAATLTATAADLLLATGDRLGQVIATSGSPVTALAGMVVHVDMVPW
jgi:hypothetical protein